MEPPMGFGARLFSLGMADFHQIVPLSAKQEVIDSLNCEDSPEPIGAAICCRSAVAASIQRFLHKLKGVEDSKVKVK